MILNNKTSCLKKTIKNEKLKQSTFAWISQYINAIPVSNQRLFHHKDIFRYSGSSQSVTISDNLANRNIHHRYGYHVVTVTPELMTTFEQRPSAYNDHLLEAPIWMVTALITSEQLSPVYNGHYFEVPSVVVKHSFDSTLKYQIIFMLLFCVGNSINAI